MTLRSAAVYARKNDFIIQPFSRTTAGAWVGSEPVQALSRETEATTLGQAIREALDASQNGIAHPTDWKALVQPLIKVAKIRSWNALQKSAKNVDVDMSEAEIRLVPTRNGGTSGDEKGYRHLPEKAVVLASDCSAEQLAAALSQALELCE